VAGRRARAPSCALKIQRGRASTYFNNLTPNCVTITEQVSNDTIFAIFSKDSPLGRFADGEMISFDEGTLYELADRDATHR
jgi:hypothetical protein